MSLPYIRPIRRNTTWSIRAFAKATSDFTLHPFHFWANSQSDIFGKIAVPVLAVVQGFWWVFLPTRRSNPLLLFFSKTTLRLMSDLYNGGSQRGVCNFNIFKLSEKSLKSKMSSRIRCFVSSPYIYHVFSEDQNNKRIHLSSSTYRNCRLTPFVFFSPSFLAFPSDIASWQLAARLRLIRCWKVWAKPSLGCVAMEIPPYLWMSKCSDRTVGGWNFPAETRVGGNHQIWGNGDLISQLLLGCVCFLCHPASGR